jgi:hypothetical protein
VVLSLGLVVVAVMAQPLEVGAGCRMAAVGEWCDVVDLRGRESTRLLEEV